MHTTSSGSWLQQSSAVTGQPRKPSHKRWKGPWAWPVGEEWAGSDRHTSGGEDPSHKSVEGVVGPEGESNVLGDNITQVDSINYHTSGDGIRDLVGQG